MQRTENWCNLLFLSSWDQPKVVHLHIKGAMTHMTRTKPPTTLAAAHQGVKSGEPM